MIRVTVLLVVALLMVACAADGESVDPAAARDQIENMAAAIDGSAASPELRAEWATARAEFESALDEAGDSLDETTIQPAIDEFQAALDARSNEVGLEVVDAWNSLRLALDALTS